MADQFPMLSLTPDVPDPVAPSAAPAQSIQQQPAAAASTTSEPLAAPTAAAAQPQASAGAIFHMPIISGKFHGMITPTTPTGSRTV